MSQQNVILTGFMGTGKSIIGRRLATRLDLQFVDTDALIVQQNGRSIPQIFAEDGEDAFRQLERDVAQELSERCGMLIATGGRLLLDEVNAEVLGRNGRIFCLTASPQTIYNRVKYDKERPLLNVPDPQAKIQQLLEERAAGYGRFPQINTDGKTIEAIVEEIVQCLLTT